MYDIFLHLLFLSTSTLKRHQTKVSLAIGCLHQVGEMPEGNTQPKSRSTFLSFYPPGVGSGVEVVLLTPLPRSIMHVLVMTKFKMLLDAWVERGQIRLIMK